MEIFRDPSSVPKFGTETVGFVPTMGALHAGHLSLVEAAKKRCDRVILSIFVNPTQFGPNEDLARYPRPFERDCDLAKQAGVDAIFAPKPETIYPNTPTLVQVPEVTEQYEGALRPGHFEGVATIVLKLFNIIQPDVAFFGEKDLQQCAVIRKMTHDLNVPVHLEFCETLREQNGLAMSSRNAYLSPDEFQKAAVIYRELTRLLNLASQRESIFSEIETSKINIRENGFTIDYLDLISLAKFAQIDQVQPDSALIFAGRIGTTRLIDNVTLG